MWPPATAHGAAPRSVHLPAQSGSSAVLERMRRGYTREAYLELADHIRAVREPPL